MPSSPADMPPEQQRSSACLPPCVSRMDLPARSSTWLCLPPGATLRAERGRIAVSAGPVMCGQVLLTHTTPHVLDTGRSWSDPAASGSTWVQLSNAGTGTALVVMTAPEPTPARHGAAWISAGLARTLRVLGKRLGLQAPSGSAASRA